MPDRKLFNELFAAAQSDLAAADSAEAVATVRTAYLGRKGKLTEALRAVGSAAPSERAALGQVGNQTKLKLEQLLRVAADTFSSGVTVGAYDLTQPGDVPPRGSKHPITLVLEEISDIFRSLGFSIVDGPEVEDDYHNFEALNIGPDHPARDMQDTFYLAGSEDSHGNFRLLPRTHTSGVQIRTMEQQDPPVRIIAPGRVYRNETEDATHSAVFAQVEGLMVDDQTTFTDLKGILEEMVRRLLGTDAKLRFRPSFFPYTEPSAEIDVSSPHLRGGEWLELAGAGMVHPAVLERVGYDTQQYRGWAFGLGPARIAMLKYGITDLRTFYNPDIRVQEQFR